MDEGDRWRGRDGVRRMISERPASIAEMRIKACTLTPNPLGPAPPLHSIENTANSSLAHLHPLAEALKPTHTHATHIWIRDDSLPNGSRRLPEGLPHRVNKARRQARRGPCWMGGAGFMWSGETCFPTVSIIVGRELSLRRGLRTKERREELGGASGRGRGRKRRWKRDRSDEGEGRGNPKRTAPRRRWEGRVQRPCFSTSTSHPFGRDYRHLLNPVCSTCDAPPPPSRVPQRIFAFLATPPYPFSFLASPLPRVGME
jgi:hypothetical protein